MRPLMRYLSRLGLIALAALIGFAAPAAAQQYDPYNYDNYGDGSGAALLNDGTPASGESMTLTGLRATPNAPVEVWMYSTPTRVATATADATGAVADITFTIPAGFEGTHNVVAFDMALFTGSPAEFDPTVAGATDVAGVIFVQQVDVDDAAGTTAPPTTTPAPGGGSLPVTGASSMSLAIIGSAILGAGLGTTLLARRRLTLETAEV